MLEWLSEAHRHDYYREGGNFNLFEAINQLADSGDMGDEVVSTAHQVRKSRNLIHPQQYFQSS